MDKIPLKDYLARNTLQSSPSRLGKSPCRDSQMRKASPLAASVVNSCGQAVTFNSGSHTTHSSSPGCSSQVPCMTPNPLNPTSTPNLHNPSSSNQVLCMEPNSLNPASPPNIHKPSSSNQVPCMKPNSSNPASTPNLHKPTSSAVLHSGHNTSKTPTSHKTPTNRPSKPKSLSFPSVEVQSSPSVVDVGSLPMIVMDNEKVDQLFKQLDDIQSSLSKMETLLESKCTFERLVNYFHYF